jgi:hypothetical protein
MSLLGQKKTPESMAAGSGVILSMAGKQRFPFVISVAGRKKRFGAKSIEMREIRSVTRWKSLMFFCGTEMLPGFLRKKNMLADKSL